MAKKEVPLLQLAHYLPDGTFEVVADYLNRYKVHLTIARSRESVLGDYRHKMNTVTHRISVNGDLNRSAFLITLLHELAHLLTFENYGRSVQAHGKEWKTVYGQILAQFIEKKVFPEDIEHELKRTLNSPGASTCSEPNLQRVLYRYNETKNGFVLIEQVPEGNLFEISDGRRFLKGPRRRTRYECVETSTGKKYLFSGVYEVKRISKS